MKNTHAHEMSTQLESLDSSFRPAYIDEPLSINPPLKLSMISLEAECIPKMSVLAAVAEAAKGIISFEDTAFFCVQHILKTNVPLFKYLIESFNAKPQNIYLSGKGYSDSIKAEDLFKKLGVKYFKLPIAYETAGQYQRHLRAHLSRVWDSFFNNIEQSSIKRIIIIDEGGHSLETMPPSLCFKYPMAGIEQTRGGLYSPAINSLPFPLIEVASCAIKRHLESPLIVKAIVDKLQKALGERTDINLNTVFGVIGNGAIGSSVTHYLISKGYTVIAYDENKDAFQGLVHKNLYRAQNASTVIARADYILGCTGKDTLKDTLSNFLHVTIGDKKFISCTSEDKEFFSLRKAITQGTVELDNRRDVMYRTEVGGKITLINGGFPMNFDPSGESVPAIDIQLTRALMLGACIQAGMQASKPEGGAEMESTQRYKLDAQLQRFVAQEFKKCQPSNKYTAKQWKLTENLDWINNNSGEGIEPLIQTLRISSRRSAL